MAPSWIALLILVTSVSAQEVGSQYRTFLHRALLDRAPVIVRARFVSDEFLSPPEIQVTTFQVTRSFRGKAPDRILVGAMGERGRAFPELEKILFLRKLKSSRFFEAVDVIDLTAAEQPVVPATLVEYLELEREKNPVELRRAVQFLAHKNLEKGSVFGIRVALREIDALLDNSPQIFTASDLVRLQTAKARIPTEDNWLYTRLCERLGEQLGATFAGCEAAFKKTEERQAFLEAVVRFRAARSLDERVALLGQMLERFGRRLRLFAEALLSTPEPILRARAAWILGELGEPASFDPLVTRLELAKGEELTARLEALGKIGSPDAIHVLQAYLNRRELFDTVALALGRLGTPAAIDALERLESRLAGSKDEESRVDRLLHLRSPAFRREEKQRRLDAREAYAF